MADWNALPAIWQATFEEAVAAYLQGGSAPIGCVLVDADGRVVARGRNGFAANRLAHAELNALQTIPGASNRTELELYSTLEPCPMCTGAIRLCQLRGVHFAARDPGAGSTDLLRASEFMREFPCQVVLPQIPSIERVVVALLIEYRERTGHPRWREHWRAYQPSAFRLGSMLASLNAHRDWQRRDASAETVFDEIAARVAA